MVYIPSSHDTNQNDVVLISIVNERFILSVYCHCITVFLIIFHGIMLAKLLSVHIFFSESKSAKKRNIFAGRLNAPHHAIYILSRSFLNSLAVASSPDRDAQI